jgi:phosphoribosylaminoimidazole (AIR) synthetase
VPVFPSFIRYKFSWHILDQTAGKEGEYDLSGCAVGIVSKDSVINGKKYIIAADFLIGLSSSGLHTNGFSLVRRLVTGPFDLQNSNYSTEQYITEKDSTGHDLARERHVEILHNIED